MAAVAQQPSPSPMGLARPNKSVPPGLGLPGLREAVAAHQARRYGVRSDPQIS